MSKREINVNGTKRFTSNFENSVRNSKREPCLPCIKVFDKYKDYERRAQDQIYPFFYLWSIVFGFDSNLRLLSTYISFGHISFGVFKIWTSLDYFGSLYVKVNCDDSLLLSDNHSLKSL